MEYFIGCSGFHYSDWSNHFYPSGLPKSEWLCYYSSIFNTVELNVTFYRFPGPALLTKLYNSTPEGFLFSVKAHRLITHFQCFRETEDSLWRFYDTCSEALREKLGPFLFQLPASARYDPALLDRFLAQINPFYNNIIEFRHESWFRNDVIEQLNEQEVTFCGVSFPGLPDEPVLNQPLSYYRFHGVPVLYYSEAGPDVLNRFASKVKSSLNQQAFVYFNNTAQEAALKDALYLKSLLK